MHNYGRRRFEGQVGTTVSGRSPLAVSFAASQQLFRNLRLCPYFIQSKIHPPRSLPFAHFGARCHTIPPPLLLTIPTAARGQTIHFRGIG